jgi:spermidine synthase
MLQYRQQANRGDWVLRDIDGVVASGRTAFQSYLFFRSPSQGMCVVLDGDIQSCAADEAIYHEALVHPAMLLHGDPRRVLIMGGGEGATAREVLRHPGVEQVVMVDLDEEFVTLCREHLADWNAGVFEDPRLDLRHEDINDYLGASPAPFDVVIGDLVDVADWDSPAASLYGDALYSRLRDCLNTGAVVATQAGALGTGNLDGHRHIRDTLARHFRATASYGQVIPSFFHLWGFVVAGDAVMPDWPSAWLALFESRCQARGLDLPATGWSALGGGFRLARGVAESLETSDGSHT